MERSPVLPLAEHTIFLWTLILTAAYCNGKARLNVTNLGCLNDYDSEMFCFWRRPDPSTNCSHDFRLVYERHEVRRILRPEGCTPENVASDDPVSYTDCICYIEVEFFGSPVFYRIELQSHGVSVENITVYPAHTVKPKPPVNVTIHQDDDMTVMVLWDTAYLHYNLDRLDYELQITSKQEPTEVKKIISDQEEFSYKFQKGIFRRGQDYEIKVRSRPSGKLYQGVWSEWSPAADWYNDYETSSLDIIRKVIPASAPVIFIAILLAYAACLYFKKRWQKDIPDPSKSHLARTMLHTSQVQMLNTDMKNNLLFNKMKPKKTICCKWLKPLTFRKQDFVEQNPENVKPIGNPKQIHHKEATNILIPEKTAIGRLISILPLVDDSSSESNTTDSEDVDRPSEAFACDSIGLILLEILEGAEQKSPLECDSTVHKYKTSCIFSEQNMSKKFSKTDPTHFLIKTSSKVQTLYGNKPPIKQLGDMSHDHCQDTFKQNCNPLENTNPIEPQFKLSEIRVPFVNMDFEYQNVDKGVNGDNGQRKIPETKQGLVLETGYKDFDSLVSKVGDNIPETKGDLALENGYKAFESLVSSDQNNKHGGNISGTKQSLVLENGYTAFDSLVSQGHKNQHGGNILGTKQGPVLENGYTAFDSSVSQGHKHQHGGNILGTKQGQVLETGYKAFDSLVSKYPIKKHLDNIPGTKQGLVLETEYQAFHSQSHKNQHGGNIPETKQDLVLENGYQAFDSLVSKDLCKNHGDNIPGTKQGLVLETEYQAFDSLLSQGHKNQHGGNIPGTKQGPVLETEYQAFDSLVSQGHKNQPGTKQCLVVETGSKAFDSLVSQGHKNQHGSNIPGTKQGLALENGSKAFDSLVSQGHNKKHRDNIPGTKQGLMLEMEYQALYSVVSQGDKHQHGSNTPGTKQGLVLENGYTAFDSLVSQGHKNQPGTKQGLVVENGIKAFDSLVSQGHKNQLGDNTPGT